VRKGDLWDWWLPDAAEAGRLVAPDQEPDILRLDYMNSRERLHKLPQMLMIVTAGGTPALSFHRRRRDGSREAARTAPFVEPRIRQTVL